MAVYACDCRCGDVHNAGCHSSRVHFKNGLIGGDVWDGYWEVTDGTIPADRATERLVDARSILIDGEPLRLPRTSRLPQS
jgi:hypothetical protein